MLASSPGWMLKKIGEPVDETREKHAIIVLGNMFALYVAVHNRYGIPRPPPSSHEADIHLTLTKA